MCKNGEEQQEAQKEDIEADLQKNETNQSPRKLLQARGTAMHIYIVGVVLLIVMMGQFLYMNYQLNKNTEKILGYVKDNHAAIYSMTGSISSSVAATQEEAQNPFEMTSWRVAEDGFHNKRVMLKFDVAPKVYTQDTKIDFEISLSSGKKIIVQGEKQNMPHYTAEVEIPFCDVVDAVALLKNGDETQVKNLGSLYLKDEYALVLNSYLVGSYSIAKNKIVSDGLGIATELSTEYPNEEKKKIEVRKAEMVVYVNEKEYIRIPMVSRDSIWQGEDYDPNTYITYGAELSQDISVKQGDTIKFQVEVKDSNGLKYRQLVEKWLYDGSDDLHVEPGNGEFVVE